MSQEIIENEIRWQVEGDEDYARHNPRFYTYRIITVLGLEMNLDIIYSMDKQVLGFAGEDEDDEDSFAGGDDLIEKGAMDYDPEEYDDIQDFEEDADPGVEVPPLTEEEEAELLIKFPDKPNQS